MPPKGSPVDWLLHLSADIYLAWSRFSTPGLKGIFSPLLARLYGKLYQRTRDLRYLNASIKYSLVSLATRPVDHPSLPHYQQRLADSLRDRYRRLQHERDLHLSTMLQKSALASISSTHPDARWYRGGLHMTYRLRYLHTGNALYLEQSISLALLAASESAPGSSDMSFWHQRLADSYHLRYSKLGMTEDLDSELQWGLSAVESSHPADPNLPTKLTTLAIAYSDRYAHYSAVDDIDLGLFWSHKAVSLTPDNHPDYFIRKQNLANLYSDRYQLLGNTQDIEKAIELCYESIDGLFSNPSALTVAYHNLSIYYTSRHSKIGYHGDLDLAIEYSLKAIGGSLSSSPNFGLISGQCAVLFLERYQSQGKLEDLETATKWSQASVVAVKDMPGKAPKYQFNYATVLYIRYRRHRDRKDLDQSFQWCSSAIQLSRKGDPNLLERQNLLTLIYLDLFRVSHNYDALEQALNSQREVVSNTPAGHPDAADRYSNLAATHSLIYQHKGGLDHRDAALNWNHAAVDAASASDPRLYIYKNALSLQYLNRYYRLRNLPDLDLSLKLGGEVLTLIPPGHVMNSRYWQVMADAYAEKYNVDHELHDLKCAVEYFRKASDASGGDPSSLWKVADRWASFLEVNRSPGCLEAYKAAYRILPDLFWIGSRMSSRHESLVKNDVKGITTRAITACIEFEHFNLAIEFLEQSLSLTFQQLLNLRTDLSLLEEKHPHYASRLQELSSQLQTAAVSAESDLDILTIPSQPSLRDKQRVLAMEREELLKKIRQMHSFELFLLPTPFEILSSAAQSGPIIMINCSAKRCDALILKPGGNVVRVILPGVASKVFQQCENLRRALRYNGVHIQRVDGVRGVRNAFLKKDDGEKILTEVLAWIWQSIVSPVFNALEENGFTDGRIWWCPNGPLKNLPLHAASPQDCRYVQSYTSTLSALIRARSSPSLKGQVKVVAIGLAEVGPKHRSFLPNVIREIEALKTAIAAEHISVILNTEATLEKVQGILPQSRWLHLACHGQQGDTQNPLKSGLLLYNDEKLELQELISTPIPAAEFVFLSACETAMGDTDMTNESLHLAGGMIFAGFKAATGTLWAINDLDAPVVAKAFYSHLFRNGNEPSVTDTSEALHLAVKELRETGVPLHRWIPFIHIGI